MGRTGNSNSIQVLQKKCHILETQCADYVDALETTNQRLQREIDNRRLTETRLRASELKFRKTFENAPFGAAMWDLKGKLLMVNEALGRMLGYGRGELERMHYAQLTHQEDIDLEKELIRQLSAGRVDHYRLEKRYLHKTGRSIWGSTAVTMIGGIGDEGPAILGMVEDISKRRQAEETVIKARDELEHTVAMRTREIRILKDRLQAENVILKQELAESRSYGAIIGQSHSTKTVISQIELVAPTDASVLIHGESGTGKELVAREIQKRGHRSRKPLIKVNCATIPKDLYESEFFGHAKGAFTGAIKDRVGRFEAADGGTIFLDEIGEIPPDLQSKLLRILQEGEYERVGEDRTRRVDVRIIAATNKNLVEEVKAKRFRDDLFYRLNVFPIHIAPLRDRKDDIPPLAAHFAARLSKELNVRPPRLTRANIMDLQAYDWPGNVRELENAIERALILSRSDALNFKPVVSNATPYAGNVPVGGALETILTVDDFKALERRNTLNALRASAWKIYGPDGAARRLNLKPTTLIERMKRMHIKKPADQPNGKDSKTTSRAL